jgi:O-antigen/teichoic acid export membrane protein
MDKAIIAGQESAKGGFWLFIGKIASTVILAVATILIGKFISVEDYGLYAISLIPASTLLLFQDWGISPALTKYCAKYRVTNEKSDLRSMIKAGLIFGSITGTALTILSLLISNFIGTAVFSKPGSSFFIAFVSITILPISLSTAIDSILIGFDRMNLTSLTIILRSTVYFALSPILVYIGYGALGAVVGYVVSIFSSFVVEIILLYFAIFRKLDSNKIKKSPLFQSLKPLLLFGFPLAIGGIVAGLTAQFYSFAMASFVDAMMIGNYQIAQNFAIALQFLTFPITTVLFPAFSKFNPQKEGQTLKKVFTASVKYTSLFVVPASMALMVLSQPIVGMLYGDKWFYAPIFLSFIAIGGLFRLLGNLSMTNLLNGIGQTKIVMKLSILTFATGIPAALFLIPQFGIPGYIFVSFGANIPTIFVSIYWIWKHYEIKVDYQNSTKIFLASAIAAIITYLFLNIFVAADWVLFTAGFMLFLAIYLIVAPFIGAVNQTDINTLRALFSNLTIISRPLEVLLTVVEQPLKLRNKQSKTEKQ